MVKTSKAFASIVFIILTIPAFSQVRKIRHQISMPLASTHHYHVELELSGWEKDTLNLKIPQWMPGYYQIMNYGKSVEHMIVADAAKKNVSLKQIDDHSWRLVATKKTSIHLSYDVKADKKFVANSYVDEEYGYIVSAGVFLYVDGFLDTPVSVKVIKPKPEWRIATGLQQALKKIPDEFISPDFDTLYDCPILVGNLEELSSFTVKGIEHRFIGIQLGDFERAQFMEKLQKVVEASVAVIGNVPYQQYTFIAIGPGRGGIEHLNNTTFSFDGNTINTVDGMNRMFNFLAHEYFHHYNVKRIRPFELGPFDYDHGSRTNLLWVSEGLSVYYEYMVVKRAGLIDEQTLFSDFEKNINAVENNPGRLHQSLAQASYATWSDGPFGTTGDNVGKTISYYDKGPVFGLFLDLAIRHESENAKSLDDVMRFLYWHYYKQLGRGFTDAEFQQACEMIASKSLSELFEYVYTTRELDYDKYLGYAGLRVEVGEDVKDGKSKKRFLIKRLTKASPEQLAILKLWQNEK